MHMQVHAGTCTCNMYTANVNVLACSGMLTCQHSLAWELTAAQTAKTEPSCPSCGRNYTFSSTLTTHTMHVHCIYM